MIRMGVCYTQIQITYQEMKSLRRAVGRIDKPFLPKYLPSTLNPSFHFFFAVLPIIALIYHQVVLGLELLNTV